MRWKWNWRKVEEGDMAQLRVTGLCEGNPSVTGGFPSQMPVTRKMFQFDDVIMELGNLEMISLPSSQAGGYIQRGAVWHVANRGE